MAQRGNTGTGQILGMNMVGIHVVSGTQRRQALFQALERQTIGGIDARCAQDGNRHAILPPPGAQATLGVNATRGTAAFRLQATRFVDDLATAITVHPGRTNVDQAAW